MNSRKTSLIYLDGSFIKVNSNILEAFTPGIFQGKGVFETILAIGNRIVDVSQHLIRLNKGFGSKVKITKSIVQQVVNHNGYPISRVRVLVWKEAKQTHVLVMALNYKPTSKKILKACFLKTNRLATSRYSHCKSLDYSLFAKAYQKAKDNGFDEAILINQQGFVFEASRANIFWIQGGVLYTPPLTSGCLAGVTRLKVINAAKKLRIQFKEKNILPAQLIKADLIFLTNSLIGINQIYIRKPFLKTPPKPLKFNI